MARLRNQRTRQTITLEYEHTVGRSPRCALQLAHNSISAQHASIRWTGREWELRDLGSVNRTFLDGHPVDPRQGYSLAPGSRLIFGSLLEEWELDDADPPAVMLTALDGSAEIIADRELIGIPSADDPQATAYCGSDGRWRLEQADSPILTLDDQRIIDIAGRSWRFSCPALFSPTARNDQAVDLADLALEFRVSRDEEHVEIVLTGAAPLATLAARGHNYLLLTLARIRLEDAQRNLPDTSCGWADQAEITHGLSTSPELLNLDIFRIRRQFEGLGIRNAANAIERRPRAKQLRIGIKRLAVTPL